MGYGRWEGAHSISFSTRSGNETEQSDPRIESLVFDLFDGPFETPLAQLCDTRDNIFCTFQILSIPLYIDLIEDHLTCILSISATIPILIYFEKLEESLREDFTGHALSILRNHLLTSALTYRIQRIDWHKFAQARHHVITLILMFKVWF